SIESAAQRLIEQTREIREAFDALDQRLQTIDARHSQFVSSAVRAVELHLTASSTTSGQLHSILSHLLTDETGAANQPPPQRYPRLVSSFELGLIDESSLAPPKRAAVAFVPEVVAAPSLSAEEIAEGRRQTLRSLARAIGRDRVRRFAAELLRHSDEARGGESHLKGPQDLPVLIYFGNYVDGSLGYGVEESEDAEWIERDGIGFRDFVIRKSEAEQPEPSG